MKRIQYHVGCALGALVIGGLAQPALAQETGAGEGGASNEIVVTAQRRAERQVDVPISVASLGSEQLESASVDEISDIAKVTPGVRFDFSSGFFQPTIRGVGTANVTSGGGSNVGIYVDGFYSPNTLAADFDLMRIQSIQVLKGPQGTLFGRNTTGGAILVQSAEPSEEDSGAFKASYGRFQEAKLQGYFTTGLAEGIAVDMEGLYKSGNGWQHNIQTDKREGDYENWTIRTGLKVDLGAVSILARYQHSDVDDPTSVLSNSWNQAEFGTGQPFFAQPGQYAFKPNQRSTGSVGEFFRMKSNVYQLTIKADLGFADLASYSQHRRENVDSSLDLDHSGVDLFQLGLPNINRTTSQEFLLTSKPGSPLQWTAGLFYFSNKDRYVTFIDNAGSSAAKRIRLGGSSTTTKSLAGFLDLTYELTPQIFITAGARYAQDKVTDAYWNPRFSAAETPVPSISGNRLTPRFVIRYKPNDDASIYASYTKGYKAAIIDVGGSCQNAPFQCNDVRPESINAFEVGGKYSTGGLSFELAGFYYDYKNLQVSLYKVGTAEVINAAKSEIYGLDGQVRYEVTPAFQVNAGAAWTHARYKRFDNAPIYTPCPASALATCGASGISFLIVGQNLENVPMQRTPAFTANIGANYGVDLAGGELMLSGNFYHSSKFHFGPAGTQFLQPAYQTLALRAQWTDPSDRYSVALWGDNVTNSRYRTGAQYTNFGIGSNWNKPATYGVEVGIKF
mgnify:FL=1